MGKGKHDLWLVFFRDFLQLHRRKHWGRSCNDHPAPSTTLPMVPWTGKFSFQSLVFFLLFLASACINEKTPVSPSLIKIDHRIISLEKVESQIHSILLERKKESAYNI